MLYGRISMLLLILGLACIAPAAAQDAPPGDVHLGVASCAGNNCHGAVEPFKTSRVAQNEYLVWVQKDKHSKAFAALQGERGRRIAANLGLADAEHAELCLNCHTDNVPAVRRGPQFQLSDGVGCEACHGGAKAWLGIHISGGGHDANLAAGMYPTEQPLARAERCLSCHLGDDKHLVTHRLLGAGHPPLRFELDTYTEIQPAHYRVDEDYINRKGRPNDIQIWAVGQAADLKRRMEAVAAPQNAPKGVQPELALFDCQACHHPMDQLQWRPRKSPSLPPGQIRIQDATAVMLQAIAMHIDPEIGARLSRHAVVLHQATTEQWRSVQGAALDVGQVAAELLPLLARRQFSREDAYVLAAAVIATAVDDGVLDYSAAQQQAMALASILAAIKALGFAEEAQVKAMNTALEEVYEAVQSDQNYRPEPFVQALKRFAAALPGASSR